MEKKQIDFLMIMGNAISDEEMFVAAKKIQKQKEHYFVKFFDILRLINLLHIYVWWEKDLLMLLIL
jgi:hypothetical protein